MKKIIVVITCLTLVTACNNEKKQEEKTAGDKKTGNTNITYPYTPEYTTDFSVGDPNHAKLVLDFVKDWENNNIADMRSKMTDSVFANFADGGKFKGLSDTLLAMGQSIRNNYTKLETKIDTWMPIHANDKNEDWVLLWEKDYTTAKDGKVDSMASHSYWMIKNNKIAGWVEFQAKLSPPETK